MLQNSNQISYCSIIVKWVALDRLKFTSQISYLLFVDNDRLHSTADVELKKLVEHKILLHNCKYLRTFASTETTNKVS